MNTLSGLLLRRFVAARRECILSSSARQVFFLFFFQISLKNFQKTWRSTNQAALSLGGLFSLFRLAQVELLR